MTRNKIEHVPMATREEFVNNNGLYHLWLDEMKEKEPGDVLAGLRPASESNNPIYMDDFDQDAEEAALALEPIKEQEEFDVMEDTMVEQQVQQVKSQRDLQKKNEHVMN